MLNTWAEMCWQFNMYGHSEEWDAYSDVMHCMANACQSAKESWVAMESAEDTCRQSADLSGYDSLKGATFNAYQHWQLLEHLTDERLRAERKQV